MRRRLVVVLRLLGVCAVLAVGRPAPANAATDETFLEQLVVLLAADDADFRAIALDRIRHGGGGADATRRVAATLPSLPADRQAELVAALGTRGDAVALEAIAPLLAGSADAAVRLAAIGALGELGGPAEVGTLGARLAGEGAEADAAARALVQLRGADAATAIRTAARSGAPAARARLYDVLRTRRDRATVGDCVGAAASGDPQVRVAAMKLLRTLGGPAEVPGMVAAVLAAEPGPERQEAERAVVTVCTKNPGHAEAAGAFLDSFRAAPPAVRDALLPILGAVGGPGALEIADGLVASPDAATRRLGIAALARWPDASVVSRVLDLVARTSDAAERDLLVGGLIRIAPLPDNGLDDAAKLELARRTLDLCRTDEERRRLLERASAIRTIETLRFVTPFLADPALAEPACRSVVELAHHRQLRDDNRVEFAAALDTVIATTKDAELVERAGRYKAGKTWERRR
jgi:hypothetical protein